MAAHATVHYPPETAHPTRSPTGRNGLNRLDADQPETPTPEPEPTPQQPSVISGARDFTDSDGYTFRMEYSFSVNPVRVSIENDPPGYQTVSMSVRFSFRATNTTPGRNYNPYNWGALGEVAVGGFWPLSSLVCEGVRIREHFEQFGDVCFRRLFVVGGNAEREEDGIIIHRVADADLDQVVADLTNGPLFWGVFVSSLNTFDSQCDADDARLDMDYYLVHVPGDVAPLVCSRIR